VVEYEVDLGILLAPAIIDFQSHRQMLREWTLNAQFVRPAAPGSSNPARW
jgi:hypothetical protein